MGARDAMSRTAAQLDTTEAMLRIDLEERRLLAQPVEDVAAHLEAWLELRDRRRRLELQQEFVEKYVAGLRPMADVESVG